MAHNEVGVGGRFDRDVGMNAETQKMQAEFEVSAIPPEELAEFTQKIVTALKTVYDPEIPVDIYELGLIYKVDISDDRCVEIDMTLTAPGCPVAGEKPRRVEAAAAKVEGVKTVKVNLVFDPPWTPAKMSDEAKLELNML